MLNTTQNTEALLKRWLEIYGEVIKTDNNPVITPSIQ